PPRRRFASRLHLAWANDPPLVTDPRRALERSGEVALHPHRRRTHGPHLRVDERTRQGRRGPPRPSHPEGVGSSHPRATPRVARGAIPVTAAGPSPARSTRARSCPSTARSCRQAPPPPAGEHGA